MKRRLLGIALFILVVYVVTACGVLGGQPEPEISSPTPDTGIDQTMIAFAAQQTLEAIPTDTSAPQEEEVVPTDTQVPPSDTPLPPTETLAPSNQGTRPKYERMPIRPNPSRAKSPEEPSPRTRLPARSKWRSRWKTERNGFCRV